jgi:hypothetical protein
LPPRPQVNDEDFDLYVECFTDPQRAVTDGIPSSTLFLTGHLDRDGLASRTSAEYLLQLKVYRGGAVDVGASEVTPPHAVARALAERDTYILPAGWLGQSTLTAALRVNQAGVTEPAYEWDESAVLLRTDGAAHGVPGLPGDVRRWPEGRLRTSVTRYLLVSEDVPFGECGWQRVYSDAPDPAPGHRLLQVRIGRSLAIDMVATAAQLDRLRSVQSAARQLVDDGVEILLPASSYPQVTIRRVWRHHRGSWRPDADRTGRALPSLSDIRKALRP